MKIIYIEDNKLDFIIFKEMFKDKADIEITGFTYLSDFLKTTSDYDLVVADLSLPDAYGPDVLNKIRQVTNKPIIALSGVGGQTPPIRLKKTIKDSGAIYFASKNKDDLNNIKQIITHLK